MSACHCCMEPVAAGSYSWEQKVGYSDWVEDTATAAWSAAVDALPEFTGTLIEEGISTGFQGIGLRMGYYNKSLVIPVAEDYEYRFRAIATRHQYRWAFYTPTCFFKIWWDIVISDHPYPPYNDALSTVAQSYEWTPASVDGFCLPADFTELDRTTWPSSPFFTIEPIEPPAPTANWEEGTGWVGGATTTERYVALENIRFSFVNGYTPPEDGSANGFPV